MSTDEDLIDRVETAQSDLERARDRVDEIGEDRLRSLEDAYEDALSLLGSYEDRATGSGNFRAYIEFQDEIAAFVEGLPEDLPEREAFESVSERMEQRRLTEDDFEAARETLEPAASLIDRLEERSDAEHRLRSARQAIKNRIYERQQEIDRLQAVLALADADLDAPVCELRDPIETYNDSVDSDFESFLREAPAREVVSLVRSSRQFPLVDFDSPPDELARYLSERAVGTETLSTLFEYSEYSRSKLAHYVEDPATFQRVIGGNMTYLDRLDADPLTIEWPPPPAAELRWRAGELVSMLNRFAREETIEALQSVRDLTRKQDRYRRLRRAARAQTELNDDERERLKSGEIEEDLEAARERVSNLRDALERTESP
ncbi:MAG: hypothetical protein ABEJ58_04210 [Halodesulfurarchaeum sp.]